MTRFLLNNIHDQYDFEYMMSRQKIIGESVVLENLIYGIKHKSIRKDIFLNSLLSLINRLNSRYFYMKDLDEKNPFYHIWKESHQIFENYIEIITATPYIDKYLRNYRILDDERFYDFIDMLVQKRTGKSIYRNNKFNYYNGYLYGELRNTFEIKRLKNTIIDKTRILIYA